ncbi:hypothetical protein [Nocardioides ferulae]|uniref:hypothetical protein n=1 Tax=Nocardioides ferulae TaxID=2340821 RepID=UPI000EB0286E|nr:hypothetical protein [Nocardioides ferulae]
MSARSFGIAVMLAAAVAPFPQQPAAASCAAPSLEVPGAARTPVVLHAGERVTVTGRGFVEGCDDTGGGSVLGCSGGDEGETEEPMSDVELVLLHGRPTPTQVSLAVADAGTADDGRLGQVTWTFTVPADQPLGPAVLKTEGSEPLRVRIVG